MTTTILAATLSTLFAVQQQTDTLIAVRGDTRISVSETAGDIRIEAWDRDEVRIVADHGSRDAVEVEYRNGTMRIDGRSRQGLAIMDFWLRVPEGASLEVSAPFADVTVAGTRGNVEIESVEGDIDLIGGAGHVNVHAVDGEISIEDASGEIEVSAVDGSVVMTNVSGSISVTTVDGDLILTRITSDRVEAATVDGDIEWDGPIRDGGTYSFVTHDGDLNIAVGEGTNAKFSVASFDAEFTTDLELQLDRVEQGRRFQFTLGAGTARVELESFDGTINLLRR